MQRNVMQLWGFVIGALLLFSAGCGGSKSNDTKPTSASAEKKGHDHPGEGPHQGALTEWGEEEYHVEFTVDHKTQESTIYILDESAKKAKPVDSKSLTLSLKLQPPVAVTLDAKPLEGDPAGQASRFVGKHEVLGKEQEFSGTISGQVGTKKYSGDFKETPHEEHANNTPANPSGQPNQREKELFLMPGGIYSQADIEKNGNTVPSVKYRGIAFEHDDNLKPGDKICPVTVNKADENCSWWVNGKQYQFCCPPCLEKFVKQAKESPEKIKDPSDYIKK